MTNPWLAWADGDDPAALDRAVRQAHERFVTGTESDDPAAVRLRSVVRDSWLRSVSGGFDPEHGRPPVTCSTTSWSPIGTRTPSPP